MFVFCLTSFTKPMLALVVSRVRKRVAVGIIFLLDGVLLLKTVKGISSYMEGSWTDNTVGPTRKGRRENQLACNDSGRTNQVSCKVYVTWQDTIWTKAC